MRDYRFRAKCIEPIMGEYPWLYGFGVSTVMLSNGKAQCWLYTNQGVYEVDPETVGQYTGVTDKNGKSIFDGQTVLITGEQELDFGLFFQWNDKAVVRWSDDECGFYLDVIKKREANLCQDGYFTVDTFPLRKWEEGEWDIEYEVLEVTHG